MSDRSTPVGPSDDVEQALMGWLRAEAPDAAPFELRPRVLGAVEGTRQKRRWLPWPTVALRPTTAVMPMAQFALGGAVVVMAAVLALGLYANRPGLGGPAPLPSASHPVAAATPTPVPTEEPSPTGSPSDDPTAAFVGDWVNDTDADGGHQTMAVTARPNGSYRVTIRDDLASVCDGASSTMRGVAEEQESGTIVIAQPDYTCDDGSEAQALSGPPLEEQLRDLGFTYDPGRDDLQDSFGSVWSRAGAEPDGTPPAAEETPSPDGQSVAVAGDWEATDPPPDNSNLTMAVIARPNGTYRVTIRDDLASVCGGASSTMRGVAEEQESGTIVIEQPDFICDDGSEAHALSGPPLEEQLHNLGFSYDPGSDELQDSLGLVWSRVAMGP